MAIAKKSIPKRDGSGGGHQPDQSKAMPFKCITIQTR